MAKIFLDVESNGLEAFHKATQTMGQLNDQTEEFGKNGKKAFSDVSKETDNLTNKIQKTTQESVNSSNKILTGEMKLKAEKKFIKGAIEEIIVRQKELNKIIENTAPGNAQVEYRKKLAETNFDLGEMKNALKEIEEQEDALAPPVDSLLKKLRDLKAQIAITTDPADYQRLVHEAGELQEKINTTNKAVGAFAAESKVEVARNLFQQIGHDLSNLDFKGASEKAKQFATVMSSISFSETIKGVKDFGSALLNVGKAMLTNPFTVLLISVVALGLAAKDMFDSMNEGLQSLENLSKSLKGVTESTNDLRKANRDLALERRLLLSELTESDKKTIKAQTDYGDKYVEILNQQKEEIKKFNEEIKAERDDESVTSSIKDALGFETSLTKRQKEGLVKIQETYNNKLIELDKNLQEQKLLIAAEAAFEEAKKRKEDAEKRKQEMIQYAKDLAAALVDLAKRAEQAELAMLNGRARLDKQKEIADEEIELLRQELIKKQVLSGKGNKLAADVEEEFNKLRLQNAKNYSDGIIAIEVENANLLAQQEEKKTKNALELFDLRQQSLINAANAARKPEGVDDATFERQKELAVLEIQKKGIQERLQLEIDEINNSALVKVTAYEQELKLIKDKTDETSLIRRKGLEADIEMIKAKTPEEIAAIKSKLDAELSAIDKSIKDVNKSIPKVPAIDWAKILGVSNADLSILKQQFQGLLTQVQGLVAQQFALEKQLLDNQLQSIDMRINARQVEVDDLQNKLADEKKLQEQGQANNVARIQQELDVKLQANQKDISEQKRIQDEKKKLAKQQLIIDTALQASQMASAIAKTLNTYAAVPPLAIALAAAEVAAFITQKTLAFKAINSQQSGFRKGGYTGDIAVDKEAGVVHGQEFVNTASDTKKHRALLEGIHTKDKKMMEIGIRDLINGTGIVLTSDTPKELSHMKSEAKAREINVLLPKSNPDNERRISAIEKNTEALVRQGGEKKYVNHNGDLVIEKSGNVRIIKKKL